ncbi:MAG: D-alanyl-D-alanine carboxypeptidase, partial [Candidatus Binatia bacterium]
MNVTGKSPARQTLRNFYGLFNARVWLTAMLVLAATVRAAPAVELDRLLARYGFAAEDVGYVLFDPVNGRVIAAHQPDLPRIPASTTKIVTLIAALKILGEEYRFETAFSVTGEVIDGTLHGSVYLRGGGDPTLSTDDLREFVTALRQAGIVRVSGSFIFDDSFLARSPQIDARQPLAASYNPGLSALSVNYNRILLRWQREPGARSFLTTVLSPAAGGNLPVETISTDLLPNGLDQRIKFL